MNKYVGGGGGGGGGGGSNGNIGALSKIFVKHVQVNEANAVVQHKDTSFESEVVDLSLSTAAWHGRVRIVPQEDIREIDCGRGLAQLLAIDPLPSYKTLADNGVVAGMFLLIATPAYPSRGLC